MDAGAIAVLLARCQAGDRAAWDVLVDAYWQRLFGYALRATNNAELRILVNLVRDHGRGLSRHPTQSTVIEIDGERIELTDELSGKVPPPFDPLHLQEAVDALQTAMRELPEGDRQILLLRHFADMPFKDIARTLNCPIGTVLARAHRALGKLRGLMEIGHEQTEREAGLASRRLR